jgi:hypothetical protein
MYWLLVGQESPVLTHLPPPEVGEGEVPVVVVVVGLLVVVVPGALVVVGGGVEPPPPWTKLPTATAKLGET